MNIRWDYLLIPSFVVSFVLLASSQLTFLRGSLSTDSNGFACPCAPGVHRPMRARTERRPFVFLVTRPPE